jgi:hypothetical protein
MSFATIRLPARWSLSGQREQAKKVVDARLVLEREAAAEQAIERELEAAAEWERERERVEVMVERRPSAPTCAPTESLWPSHIRRPTRGRRW